VKTSLKEPQEPDSPDAVSRPKQPRCGLKAPQDPDNPAVVSRRLKNQTAQTWSQSASRPREPRRHLKMTQDEGASRPRQPRRGLKAPQESDNPSQMWSQKALKNPDPRTTTLIVQEVSECSLSVQHITVSFVFTETFCTLACCTPPRASLPPLPIPLSYASQRRG